MESPRSGQDSGIEVDVTLEALKAVLQERDTPWADLEEGGNFYIVVGTDRQPLSVWSIKVRICQETGRLFVDKDKENHKTILERYILDLPTKE